MTPHHRARKTRLTAPAALTMGALLGLSLSQLIEGQAIGIIGTLLMTGLLLAAPNALRLTQDKPGTHGLGVASAATGTFFALSTQAQNEPQLIALGLGLGCAALSLWMSAQAKRSRAGLRNGHHTSKPKAPDVPAQPSLTQGLEQWGTPADTSAAPRPKSTPKAEKTQIAQLTARRSREPGSHEPGSHEPGSQKSLNHEDKERRDQERREQERRKQERRDRQAEEEAIQAEQERRRQQDMAWAAINWSVGLPPPSQGQATERQDHRQESCSTSTRHDSPRHDSVQHDSPRYDSPRYDSCTDDNRSRSSSNDTGYSVNTDSGSSSNSDSGSSSSPSFE